MAIRRRRPAAKAAQAPTSRVHAVSTAEQFWSMMDKAAAAKRLVVVQLYQVCRLACPRLAPALCPPLHSSAQLPESRRAVVMLPPMRRRRLCCP